MTRHFIELPRNTSWGNATHGKQTHVGRTLVKYVIGFQLGLTLLNGCPFAGFGVSGDTVQNSAFDKFFII